MTPLDRYRDALEHEEMIADLVQEQAVILTQDLYRRLTDRSSSARSWYVRLWNSLVGNQPEPVRGIYFWGGVGRGKTWVVDSFYESLPFERKLRIHFHRFMQRVHHELKGLKQLENPLHRVADRFSTEARVICFDEFHVADITDAMLLSGLLEALYSRGITLVATSNEHPDQLYRDGLQRDRFLPAIESIKQHCKVVNLDSGTDYRLRYLDRAKLYHHPLDEDAEPVLIANFTHLAPEYGRLGGSITIEGRQISTVRCADGVVWFDFYAICDGPRGPADYIEVARLFQTVLIANVPQMAEDKNDMAKRFMILVDEFYDRHVKLILTAAVAIPELYQGKRHREPFQRTLSRLIEMQSHDYLALRHLP